MKTIKCHRCGESFGLADDTYTLLQRSGRTFCCPWGHEAVFRAGETEADKLRRERDRLKQNEAWLEQRLNSELDQRAAAERRASAARGQVTKIKKRVAGGACPCCNRTFENLARHMATKHAGFVAEEVAPDGVTVQ